MQNSNRRQRVSSINKAEGSNPLHGKEKNMLKVDSTYHAGVERIDRITECIVRYGLGEIALEVYSDKAQKLYRLTETGMLLVFDKDGKTLVSGYMCNIEKCIILYKLAGKSVPPYMKKTVIRNCDDWKKTAKKRR